MATKSYESTDYSQAPDEPYVVEYYYTIRWGHLEEFLALFRKNHLPVLERQAQTGRIMSMSACEPRFHTTENSRWDYRFTIVFKNVVAAHDRILEAQIVDELYPDKEAFHREEVRRFELMLAHWDIPLRDIPLQDWRRTKI